MRGGRGCRFAQTKAFSLGRRCHAKSVTDEVEGSNFVPTQGDERSLRPHQSALAGCQLPLQGKPFASPFLRIEVGGHTQHAPLFLFQNLQAGRLIDGLLFSSHFPEHNLLLTKKEGPEGPSWAEMLSRCSPRWCGQTRWGSRCCRSCCQRQSCRNGCLPERRCTRPW